MPKLPDGLHPIPKPPEIEYFKGDLRSLVRNEVLDEASTAISSDRNQSYGEPHDNFSRISGMMNAAGYRGPGGRLLQPHDTALIMNIVKISRLMHDPAKKDSWVDMAGYSGCGYESVIREAA